MSWGFYEEIHDLFIYLFSKSPSSLTSIGDNLSAFILGIFLCVLNDMEYNEFILIGIGTAISVLGYFLKRENKRLEAIELLVNQINVTLAKNEVRDSERNGTIEKRLEDRRVDVRKLYDLVQKN